MTNVKKYLALCCAAILLFALSSCSGYAPSITISKPSSPTISESISSIKRNGYRITSTQYYNVISLTTDNGKDITTSEQEVSAGRIALIRLRSASGNTIRVSEPHIIANMGSGVRVGQRCAYVKGVLGDTGTSLNFVVFGSDS